MRALVLEEFGGLFVRKEVARPHISPDEALVRVRYVGVCGTDLKIRAGRMGLNVLPLVMGHSSRPSTGSPLMKGWMWCWSSWPMRKPCRRAIIA